MVTSSSGQSPKYPGSRRAKLFEQQFGVLGFFVISTVIFLLLLLLCFFFFYASSSNRTRIAALPSVGLGLMRSSSNGGRRKDAVRDDDCDLFQGEWVWDERYPLYDSRDCAFLDEGFRCSENGRPDRFYTKWRWQPSRCNLPR